ncbi:MAG: hydantoinase/oxoprolinase family protein [Acidobacteria bacterium]|nr:hydantoinase/oxoprolinase family protein [Acidobacteriota bacterium]
MKEKKPPEPFSVSSSHRIGVDSGGTFTDCVLLRGSRIEILKVFSDPQAPRATLDAVRQLLGEDAAAAAPAIIHGTTVGTNALLERRGARVALVTTAGFEDLIEIGRQNRSRLYDLNLRRDPPLIPRHLRLGLAERTAADGKILRRPAPGELRKLRARLARCGAESVAICLLFSYANPANEQALLRALRGFGLPVSVSDELLPEFREYERLSTTVINAYLAPRVGGYLTGLERETESQFSIGKSLRRAKPRLYMMQSSGGITTAARAAREPVRTILSGPAGGVVGTGWLAALLRLAKVISFDMGGTSTDVCLLDGGAQTTRETTLAGLPVAVPVLDVNTVGAGGGSLARFDAGGALRVGPESAGATPGPACYGRGGAQPTITDAHLILGRLDPDGFLGGGFRLDRAAAEKCFDDFLRRARQQSNRAGGAWRTREELAAGIIAVGNATMEKALRVISVERGYDPREFSLVCFGGAGGLHAADLARSLGLARVIVPQNPGAFSAIGVLLSDVVSDISQTMLLAVPGDSLRAAFRKSLDGRFAELERKGRARLRDDGFNGNAARAERRLEMRYRGQSYELSIPYTPRLYEEFHYAHERAYGYSDPARPLEVVNLRVRLTIPTPKPPVRPQHILKSAGSASAVVQTTPVWFAGRPVATPFYERVRLGAGMTFRGPAIVNEYSSTTVVPPGFVCRVDEYQNLILYDDLRQRST